MYAKLTEWLSGNPKAATERSASKRSPNSPPQTPLPARCSKPCSRHAARLSWVRPKWRGLLGLAQEDVFDTCLFTKLAEASGAPGNSTALVGTPETVANAMAAYYDLGATSLILVALDAAERTPSTVPCDWPVCASETR